MNAVELSFNFNNRQLRVFGTVDAPEFVASDVSLILGHRMASDMTRSLDDRDKGTRLVRTPSGDQNVTTITEGGLYQVIMQRQTGRMAPEAAEWVREFQRKVTHEILPEIRRTGSFGAQPALPQSYSEALRELAITVETKERLELKAERDAPKVAYVETFVADGDLRILRNVAKSLGMTEGELRTDLIARKWIYAEHTTRWSESKQEKETVTRYSPYSNKAQYFTPVPNHNAPRFKGEVMHTLKITPAGAVAIARLYGKTADLVAQAVTA